jgi:hypothetical protein
LAANKNGSMPNKMMSRIVAVMVDLGTAAGVGSVSCVAAFFAAAGAADDDDERARDSTSLREPGMTSSRKSSLTLCVPRWRERELEEMPPSVFAFTTWPHNRHVA